MPKMSAGILLFRKRPAGVEVLLVHPGGPFWRNKDDGAWSIPKGLAGDGETCARPRSGNSSKRRARRSAANSSTSGRTSSPAARPSSPRVEGDFDPALLTSNMFSMEWPPLRENREFPEVDKAGWYDWSKH